MEFRILGPLEVARNGAVITIGGGKQRALLALLLLRRNQIVPTDALIEELWHGSPPATAGKIVQLYVSRLRKALGDDVLVTRSPGYTLRVEPEEVDADRAERLLAEGRRALAEGVPAAAASSLREALGLWRGPPFADFAYEDFAQQEIGRLEEVRLAALEERIEARPGPGPARRGRRRGRDPRQPAPAAGAPSRPACARALPVRPPGGSARHAA